MRPLEKESLTKKLARLDKHNSRWVLLIKGETIRSRTLRAMLPSLLKS